MANSQGRLSDLRSGVDYVDPKYCYPAHVRDCLRALNFLKACERIQVPFEKWPTFEIMLLDSPQPAPGRTSPTSKKIGIAAGPLVFQLPEFDLFDDDHRGWKTKANRAWIEFRNKQFGPYLKRCTEFRNAMVSMGMAVPRKRTRFAGEKRDNSIPLELRYELAVRRHCLAESWSALHGPHKDLYSLERIRKSVTEILRSLGLLSKRT